MLQGQPFEVSHFLGGLTDSADTKDTSQYLKASNILLTSTGNPGVAPGATLYDSANPRSAAGDNPVGALINYYDDTKLLEIVATHLYYYNSGWTELLDPNSAVIFPTATNSSRVSWAQFREHLFLTCDSGDPVMKIYTDNVGGGTLQLLAAGLPTFPNNVSTSQKATLLANAITLANDIRSKMSTHFSTGGTTHSATQTYSFAAVASNEATLITLTLDLLVAYRLHIDDARSVAPTYHNKTNFLAVFGHFYPLELPPAEALLTCIPVLNNLKFSLNFHIQSFWFQPTGGTNLDNAFHVVTALVTASDVTLNALPTVSCFATLINNPTYQFANEFAAAMLLHYADTAGQGGHGPAGAAPDTNNVFTDTATTTYSLLRVYYKTIISFFNHRQKNANTHGDAEPTGTQLAATTYKPYFGNFQITFNTAMYPIDITTVAGMTELWAALMDVYNKIQQHAILGVGGGAYERHITVGQDFNQYVNAGNAFQGYFTYLQNTLESPAATWDSYVYALSYRNTYTTSGGKTFVNESTPYLFSTGPVTQFETLNVTTGIIVPAIPVTGRTPAMTIASIPVLPSNSGLNAGTTKKILYRTIANGTQLFEVAQLANATTSYTDFVSDAFALTQPLIYTSGGLPPNDPPPLAKYIHICNGFGYYGNVTDQYGVVYKNRVQQSFQNAQDSCPATFFVDLPHDVVGLSSVRGIPIAWTAHNTYRLEGSFLPDGSGSISYTAVSDSVGLLASYSPVQIDNALLFWGTDGIYWTDGYQVMNLNTEWKSSYQTLTASTKVSSIRGEYDWRNKQVWWTVNSGQSSINDTAYVLDLNFPLSKNSVFTTLDSGGTTLNFQPTALCFFGRQMVRGDYHGYVFVHDPATLTTPTVNTATTPSTWQTSALIYDMRSPSFDFGSIFARKWHSKTTVKAKNHGNLSLQMNLITDEGVRTASCAPIRSRNYTGVIEEKRNTPTGNYRCMTRQLQLTNALVVITNSDTLALATLNHGAKTLTINSGAFPTSPTVANQFITFPGDGYVTQWTITSATSTVLTILDPGGTLPSSGSTKWEIKGYPKDEQFELIGYSMYVSLLGPSQPGPSGESGANA